VILFSDLRTAVLLVQAAEEALLTIRTQEIAVVRRLPHPPSLVRKIMDCVLILFGRPLRNPVRIDPDSKQPEPSWENSLKVRQADLVAREDRCSFSSF
jgi:hypothetical protein